MDIISTAPAPPADAAPPTLQDVVEMLDALEAASVARTTATLEGLLEALRPAESIQGRLAMVEPATLKAALVVRAQRASGRR